MNVSERGRRRKRTAPPAAAGSATQRVVMDEEVDGTSQNDVQPQVPPIQPQLVAAVTEQVLKALAGEEKKGTKRSKPQKGSKRKQRRTPSSGSSGAEIPWVGTIHGPISNYCAKAIPSCLNETASKLLEASVTYNTQQSYKTAMSVFQNFYRKVFHTRPEFPTEVAQVICFVSWLHKEGKSHNTINTYVAGLSYYHRLNGFTDPTQFFIIKKLIKGAQQLSGTPDIRLPITPQILRKIVHAVKNTISEKFNRLLLRAMFTLSFFAFLRVGEITAKSPRNIKNVIQMENLKLDKPLTNPKYMTLTLRHFKHNASCRPVCLQIATQKCKSICPVRAMVKYIEARGSAQGPLFTFDNCNPISQAYFTSELKNVVLYTGLDPKLYRSHSFRIGAASYAFHSKVSEEKIRLMGRWNSNAVKRYFRIPVFDTIEVSPTSQTD
ncbi:integrase/recombinase xerD homolog isoform X2 [Saccostrea cucullata]